MEAIKNPKPGLAQPQQYLTFFTAGEEYAVGILKVKEIVEYSAVTTVPNMPAWIRGVTNLRGSVVPVVDLAVKFGLPPSAITKLSCIVITEVTYEGDVLTMGVLSDSVNQVIDYQEDDIEAPPPFGTRVKVEYLLGMGRSGKKFCLILDIDKVLSTDELLAVAGSSESCESALPVLGTDEQSNQVRAAGPGA
ncbi:MAG TPA: chemotaxis protein CheW [Candidatus Saccharimonadales bacterium]|nr:chemotaxis protein CheW [Candidatus Saccharimonadales bacterium]